jgi:hypothetical protein
MDRRDNQRRARRVQLQFWKRGELHPYTGYSTNFSPTGMFVSTTTPLPRGERVRLEVLDPQNGFMIEGVVMHAARVALALQQVRQSGMGVRFLRVEDLIAGLMRQGGGTSVVDQTRRKPVDGVYSVRFASAQEFLKAVERDVQSGGVFVPTDFPAPLGAVIVVEIHPPYEHAVPVRLSASVVQRLEPAQATPNAASPLARVAGMGVVFADPQSALAMLQPAIDRLTL